MEELFGAIMLIAVGWWLFKEGKHIGSRKGYHVGRMRGRRQRR